VREKKERAREERQDYRKAQEKGRNKR